MGQFEIGPKKDIKTQIPWTYLVLKPGQCHKGGKKSTKRKCLLSDERGGPGPVGACPKKRYPEYQAKGIKNKHNEGRK